MTTQLEKRYYTPEEYLALEEISEFKNEYRDGEIVPVTGGTTNHNEVAGNFYSHLKFAFRGKNYRIYMGDVRLWIPTYRLYTYPDVMVIEGKPVYEGKGITTVINPLLIVEVLSDSTKNYDRGDKFKYYRSIPELKEYILIDQYSFYIEQLTKQSDHQWLLTDHQGEDTRLTLASINFEISFKDLYENVDFDLIEE